MVKNFVKNLLASFGFYNHSRFMETSMTSDNIRALRLISGVDVFAAIMFLNQSFTNPGYETQLYQWISFIQMVIGCVVFILMMTQEKRIQKSFHIFHAGMFLFIEWLTFCGVVESATDSLNRGGFIAFLITQVWAFDLILIPPFVCVVLCGVHFCAFIAVISHMMYFPTMKYVETLIFYVTVVAVNYFHYRSALLRINQQEVMQGDNERLDKLSTTDALTNARNRTGLRIDFDHLFSDHLFVMMSDIDNFKKYNDVYGHVFGDEVLSDFSQALQDTFGSKCVYRYGGDEFLVIVSGMEREDFERKARKASEIYNGSVTVSADRPTCSCGFVYGSCHSSDDLRDMIKAADYQLYQAKTKGKNQICGEAFAAAPAGNAGAAEAVE